MPVVGFIGADASSWVPWTAAFVARLRELGWIDGHAVAIEYRWTEGHPSAPRSSRPNSSRLQRRYYRHEFQLRAYGKAGDIDHPHRVCIGE